MRVGEKEADTILQMLKIHAAKKVKSMEEARELFEQAMNEFSPPQDVIFQPTTLSNLCATWAMTPHADPKRLILFFHGGGFNSGSLHSHRYLLGKLSEVTGARVLGIDYRLAPEHRFPAALEDAAAAYLCLLEEDGYTPKQIVFAGNSAGGGLVISTMLWLKEKGKPLPLAGVCFSPWVDLALSTASLKENAGKDFIPPERLKQTASLYLGEENPRNPLASPLYADLKGLSPLLIQAASHEILVDESREIAKKAQAQGVDVTLDIWEGLFHNWQLFAAKLPEGVQALEKVAQWLDDRGFQ